MPDGIEDGFGGNQPTRSEPLSRRWIVKEGIIFVPGADGPSGKGTEAIDVAFETVDATDQTEDCEDDAEEATDGDGEYW
jgi:hypothetical protein